MSDYTPSPAEVQAHWAWTPGHLDNPEAHAVREEKMHMFDRMLAQVRAEERRNAAQAVHAEALRQTGQKMRGVAQHPGADAAFAGLISIETLLLEQADQIEREAGLK